MDEDISCFSDLFDISDEEIGAPIIFHEFGLHQNLDTADQLIFDIFEPQDFPLLQPTSIFDLSDSNKSHEFCPSPENSDFCSGDSHEFIRENCNFSSDGSHEFSQESRNFDSKDSHEFSGENCGNLQAESTEKHRKKPVTNFYLKPFIRRRTRSKRRRRAGPALSKLWRGVRGSGEVRRCVHCLTQRTPQWRAGPLGPKTLCNACGVRYNSGRLFPEYRPADSPTFIREIHSNSHRKIVEMRKKRFQVSVQLEERSSSS
ncbi:hypothetical protein AMTRI_Chr07g26060 [Amborella trichopoda]